MSTTSSSRASKKSIAKALDTHERLIHEHVNTAMGFRIIDSAPMVALKAADPKYYRSCASLIGIASHMPNSAIPVRYYLSPKQNGYGRYKAESLIEGPRGPITTYMSLQREIRAHLASDTYLDVDFVNSAPTILSQLLTTYKIPCPALDNYINNRDSCMQSIMTTCSVSRDIAKKLIIMFLHYGNIKSWRADNRVKAIPNWVNDLHISLKNAEDALINHIDFTDYVNHFHATHPGPTTNQPGKIMALILQTKERRCLDALIEVAERDGYTIGALIHDGMHIQKKYADQLTVPLETLARWKEYIFNKNDIALDIIVKPFVLDPDWLAPESAPDLWDDTWISKISVTFPTRDQMKTKWELRAFQILNQSLYVRQVKDEHILFTESNLIVGFRHLKYYELIPKENGHFLMEEFPFISRGKHPWIEDVDIRLDVCPARAK